MNILKLTATFLLALGLSSAAAQQHSSLTRGTAAPDIVANDTLGQTFRLSNLRGMWVVVDFWASWCGDCRRENPEIKKVHDEFGVCRQCGEGIAKPACGCKSKHKDGDRSLCTCPAPGIAFVGVSMDHDEKAWRTYLRQNPFNWTQVANLIAWKDNPISKAYDLHWIPSIFIIDPLGRIHSDVFTAAELREQLTEIRDALEAEN
jgi:peroxiredoxin